MALLLLSFDKSFRLRRAIQSAVEIPSGRRANCCEQFVFAWVFARRCFSSTDVSQAPRVRLRSAERRTFMTTSLLELIILLSQGWGMGSCWELVGARSGNSIAFVGLQVPREPSRI